MSAVLNVVQKARKGQGKCGKCGNWIPKGSQYRWWSFRFGGRSDRCMKSECTPRRSELTQSEFYGTLYDIEDAIGEATRDARGEGEPEKLGQELADELESQAEELRNLAGECEEKLSNMPEGLQQGEVGETLQTRADECNEKADEMDQVKDLWSEKGDYEGKLDELLEEMCEEADGLDVGGIS